MSSFASVLQQGRNLSRSIKVEKSIFCDIDPNSTRKNMIIYFMIHCNYVLADVNGNDLIFISPNGIMTYITFPKIYPNVSLMISKNSPTDITALIDDIYFDSNLNYEMYFLHQFISSAKTLTDLKKEMVEVSKPAEIIEKDDDILKRFNVTDGDSLKKALKTIIPIDRRHLLTAYKNKIEITLTKRDGKRRSSRRRKRRSSKTPRMKKTRTIRKKRTIRSKRNSRSKKRQ